MSTNVLTGIRSGAKVLVDGSSYEAGPLIGDGRIFLDKKTGDEVLLSNAAQRKMALEFRLVLDELPKHLSEHIARARAASFSIFSFVDRTIALRRLKYVQAVHELAPRQRCRKQHILTTIDETFTAIVEGPNSVEDPPTQSEFDFNSGSEKIVTTGEAVRNKLMARIGRDMLDEQPVAPIAPVKPPARSVRNWYRLYYASGQDIRVLLDLHCLKGNRTDRYPEWVKTTVEKVIDSAIAIPTPAKMTHALRLACDAVQKNSDPTERPLPKLAETRGGEELLGKNLLSRWLAKRDQYKLSVSQVGVYEARRRFAVVELGPQGDHPNHQWETDHTLLDVFVVDEIKGKAYGRPWLTVMMDRYSRCITGYSLSFAPPSWVSVMDAMRIAIQPKDAILKSLNAGKLKIDNKWECHGIPDVLVTDHGREFKSQSLDETLAVLNTKSFQVKKRKPWLKGKIERWFGTLEDVIHTIPGTAFSKFYKREFYQSEKFAILTLPQLNCLIAKWIVDVYHQQKHSKLECPPIDMWLDGVVVHKPPRKLPDSLLQPLMGLVVNRSLRKGGIKYLGLRWDSKAFSLLRHRLPAKGADVQVRIDPRDLKTAYVWDEPNDKWVVGHLKEPVEAGNYTLDQWFFVEFNRKENMEAGMSRQAAISKAIGDINDFIKGIQEEYTNTKAYKRYLEFTTGGSSAWANVRGAYYSEDDSPPGPHKVDETPIHSPPQAETGPYAESQRPNVPPKEQHDGKPDDAGKTGDEESGEDGDKSGVENVPRANDENAAPDMKAAKPENVAPDTGSGGGGKAASRRAKKEKSASAKEDTPKVVREAVSVKGIPLPAEPEDSDGDYKDDDFSGPFSARQREKEDDSDA
jgi:putative transposase